MLQVPGGGSPDGRDVHMLACFFSGLCLKEREKEALLQEEEVRASESNAVYFDYTHMKSSLCTLSLERRMTCTP